MTRHDDGGDSRPPVGAEGRLGAKAKRQIEAWKRRQAADGKVQQEADAGTAAEAAQEAGSESSGEELRVEDYFQPAGRSDYWKEYIRARWRRLVFGWLRRGGIASAIVLAILTVTQTGYGAHWPYVGEQPTHILVCWTKSSEPTREIRERVRELLDGSFNELWWRIWWGGFPVIETNTPTVIRHRISWLVQVKAYSSKTEQVCPSWAKVEAIPIER